MPTSSHAHLRASHFAVVLALVLTACGADAIDVTAGEDAGPSVTADGGAPGEPPCDDGGCGPSSGDAGPGDASPGKTCGTGTPTKCANGSECQTDEDCTSDYCDPGAKCSAPNAEAHADGRRNGGETDVDCGGTSGIACAAGKTCASSDDCTSTCTAAVCDAPSDSDGKKNGTETDVDCGGPNAKKCGVGKACTTSADCGLLYCEASACAVPSAPDAKKNGTETDVDCGGTELEFDGVTVPASPRCALTRSCAVDADCASGVCADTKVCVEAPSCRPLYGGQTCGVGETGEVGAVHESCCKRLLVPGVTIKQNGVDKKVLLDKYEITAGRIRAWVEGIAAEQGGVPDIKGWIKARMAADPLLAGMFPSGWADYLPANHSGNGQTATFPRHANLGGGSATVDLGLEDQLGPSSYYRALQVEGSLGCWNGPDGYGHRTYWFDPAVGANFGEIPRPLVTKEILDEKSANCMTPLMFAAFCAWDGGYMQSKEALVAAYGPKTWPWGDTPEPKADLTRGNYNPGTGGFGSSLAPRYLHPFVAYGSFATDLSPIIAPPGRFPEDIASVTRPGQESWMDLGANMLEWSQSGGVFYGWTGASFEGHYYAGSVASVVHHLDKYGKATSRCIHLD